MVRPLASYTKYAVLFVVLLVAVYVLVPPDLFFVRDAVVWVIFALLIFLLAVPGIYLMNRYKKEDRGRLQRMVKNVTAGIVGAVLVTILSAAGDLQLPSSPESTPSFFVGLVYLLSIFIVALAALLLPIWILLSWIEKG